ncbi:MAG TPA: MBL fold metallo-hydrolase [Hyphomonadaceae bacterium]|nr:MBL fold metallo-hydrolase [Hyphomonadaceae bacterium]
MARGLFLSVLMMAVAACANAPAPHADFSFIRGAFTPGRQPDGNSVLLNTSAGYIVVDTGRHRDHADKILQQTAGAPIAAIVNSHWHLDHVSGNLALREAFPAAAIYSNRPALEDALSGFLARGAEANRRRMADPALDPVQRDEARIDLATVEAGAKLYPSISIEQSQMLIIGGRRLEIHVAQAASAGDIWLYDPAARLAIAGDLITLPAPFLDTACPQNWRAELDAVLGTPFTQLAPGHGRLMTRADVTLYRDAFNALLDCASGAASAESCAEHWSKAAAPLLDEASGDIGQAKAYANYYVENVLRKAEAKPIWCRAAT